MKVNFGCGDRKLDGFLNLDREHFDWNKRLPFEDETFEAITVSHSLMYANNIQFSLGELRRVLKTGGVLRITEDNTENINSERFGGHSDAVSLTGPLQMNVDLINIGFKEVFYLDKNTTFWFDHSLFQEFHGEEPKVFFMEARK
jgi:ubiquinone/menaquinone biosynthesis C-methylase UbiE